MLKQDLPIMVLPPEDAGAEEEVDRAVQYVADSYNKIGRAVYRLIWDRRILQSALSKFRVVVEREDDVRLREKLERADQFLGLHVDDAVATGRSASDDSRVSEVSDFMRLYGVTPFGKLPERAPGGGVDAEA